LGPFLARKKRQRSGTILRVPATDDLVTIDNAGDCDRALPEYSFRVEDAPIKRDGT
jgi:hypothetical protein